MEEEAPYLHIIKKKKKGPSDHYPILTIEETSQFGISFYENFPDWIQGVVHDFFASGERVLPILRELDLPPISPRDIDAMVHSGRLIAVQGQVLRRSEVKTLRLVETYVCQPEQQVLTVVSMPWQKKVNVAKPKGCKWLERAANGSWYVDVVEAVISDIPEITGSKAVTEVEAVVIGKPNVEAVVPGEKAVFYGVYMPLVDDTKAVSKPKFYVFGVERLEEEIKVDEEKVKGLPDDPWHEWRVLASFSPAIWGRWDDVKRSMVYAILGGVKQESGGVSFRDKSHVLIVSGPGQGKSAIFSYIERVFPRTFLVSGSQSTSAGLVASVVKEESGWVLAVGALGLASGGVALIDEFDKISKEDMDKLLEAMEQGRVSINKASIHTIINTDATIIAVANPKKGKYDPRKTLEENIGIKATLLSRFDVILILHDIISTRQHTQELFDRMVTLTVLNRGSEGHAPHLYGPDVMASLLVVGRERLRPRLSPAAKELILRYYTEAVKGLKAKEMITGEPLPISITPRMIEAVVRLATARAKLWLREEVTEEDAMVAIWLVDRIVKMVGVDPLTGEIDFYGSLGETKRRGRVLIEEKVKAEVLKVISEMERNSQMLVNALLKRVKARLGDELRLAGITDEGLKEMVEGVLEELESVHVSGMVFRKVKEVEAPEDGGAAEASSNPIYQMVAKAEEPIEFQLFDEKPEFDDGCPFREVYEFKGRYAVWCHLRATHLFKFEKKLCRKEKCPFYKEYLRRNS